MVDRNEYPLPQLLDVAAAVHGDKCNIAHPDRAGHGNKNNVTVFIQRFHGVARYGYAKIGAFDRFCIYHVFCKAVWPEVDTRAGTGGLIRNF